MSPTLTYLPSDVTQSGLDIGVLTHRGLDRAAVPGPRATDLTLADRDRRPRGVSPAVVAVVQSRAAEVGRRQICGSLASQLQRRRLRERLPSLQRQWRSGRQWPPPMRRQRAALLARRARTVRSLPVDRPQTEKRRGDYACHGLRIMHRGPRTSGASQSLRAPRLASRWHGGDMQVCPRTWTLWRTAASPLPPLPPPPRRTGSTSTTSLAGLRHPRRRSCRPARTAHSSRGRSGPAERTAGDLPAGPRSSETCPSTRRANSTLTSARTESERE